MGLVTPEQQKEILSCCEDSERFIPEQIGWDLIRGWEVTDNDHPFAELEENSFTYTDDEPTSDMSVDEMMKAFKEAKDNWDDLKYMP